ncbi:MULTISPECIES: hypothetical protein [unclassified Mycobacterium]|nr:MULTISPECIES: hypothetical protein [unclassified Mycobacterium]MDP7706266.1 hypothetical protein [Mycobacterium sp. TY815]MDP7725964.1 hypothetical protein [Mycobacterium sp. TY814]
MAGRSRYVEVKLLVFGAYSVALGLFMILGSMISTGWLAGALWRSATRR